MRISKKKKNYKNELAKDVTKLKEVAENKRQVRGKYKFFGEVDGYLVYQPLDYLASIDLSKNTGWYTPGRYKHYGEPDFVPSAEVASELWGDYESKGIKFYYFLNPSTFYGEYALVLYPSYPKTVGIWSTFYDRAENTAVYVDKANCGLYNAQDLNIGYNPKIQNICDKLKIKTIIDYQSIELNNDSLEIQNNVLMHCYDRHIKSITIPDGVTSIDASAFAGCSALTTVTIPNSVTSIGYAAFSHCKNLTSITIPDSVTTIGRNAFGDCRNLKSITIPNSVTTIGDYVFGYCSSLTSVTIPESVTSIGLAAFAGCDSLTIYCEAKTKPSNWDNKWNMANRPVVWDCKNLKTR